MIEILPTAILAFLGGILIGMIVMRDKKIRNLVKAIEGLKYRYNEVVKGIEDTNEDIETLNKKL